MPYIIFYLQYIRFVQGNIFKISRAATICERILNLEFCRSTGKSEIYIRISENVVFFVAYCKRNRDNRFLVRGILKLTFFCVLYNKRSVHDQGGNGDLCFVFKYNPGFLERLSGILIIKTKSPWLTIANKNQSHLNIVIFK